MATRITQTTGEAVLTGDTVRVTQVVGEVVNVLPAAIDRLQIQVAGQDRRAVIQRMEMQVAVVDTPVSPAVGRSFAVWVNLGL